MDPNLLFLSFLTGTIGLAMLTFGKRAGRWVPLAAGLALMVLPYLVTNLIAVTLISVGLIASPWIIRES